MSLLALSGGRTVSLESALDGHLGPGCLREMVQDPMRYGLAELLGRCLPGQERPPRVELLRTKYKPGRKLTAYYQLSMAAESRPIALSWFAKPHAAPGSAAGLETQAGRRTMLAPFGRLSAITDNGGVELLIAPDDSVMPQLVRLNEHAYVMNMLQVMSADRSRLAAKVVISAVRYRPGQRHVLRVSPTTGAGETTFIKIDRDECGAAAVRFAEAMGPVLAQQCPGARLVKPVGYAVNDKASVWIQAPGVTLSRALRDSARSTRLLALLGKALRVIHDVDVPAASTDAPHPLPAPHQARAELASTLRAGDYIAALLPEVGERYRTLSTQALDRLDELPQEQPRLSHGDVKCDNIVADADRICVLDLDRTGLADPALDLGKLLADLRWWCSFYAVDPTMPVLALVEGYGQCDAARWSRARLLSALFQLKLAARRSPVHAVDWTLQVRNQVADAAAMLRVEPTP